MIARLLISLAGIVASAAPAFAKQDSSGPRELRYEFVVAADANEAWAAWTSNAGVQAFFPGAARGGTNIRFEPGGPYEFFFLPENPEGMRGCDGCTILGFQEGKMISFTWTNRPDMAVRPHRTHVEIHFEQLDPHWTKVVFVHDGWGDGAEWDIAYDYFSDGWAGVLRAYRDYFDRKAKVLEHG